MVKVIESATFDASVNTGIVVIDFYADWCGPCKWLMPIIEQLSTEITDVSFYKVDVDTFPEIATKYSVMNIPTLVLLIDGEPVQRMSGYQPKERIVAMINSKR